MRKLTIIAAIAAITPITALTAQEMDHSSHHMKTGAPVISLSLTGTASARPDRAIINAAVQTKAVSATDAMAQNARQMTAVLAALKARGVADKDIQTAAINLGQDYDYGPNGQKFKGYIANNMVTVRLKDVANVGAILDILVNAGATNINGPTFTIADDAALTEKARLDAIKQAASLSGFYAKNTGYARAVLLSISEGADYNGPQPVMTMKLERAQDAGATTPVEAGEVTKSVTISVKYRLEQ